MSDAATINSTTPASGAADAPHQGPSDQTQSPERLPVSVIAQRQIMKTCAVGSPARRSPRLSCLPPPQPSIEYQDTSSDDDSESVNDVALHLSRDETPENDPPDEPSTVLVNRILRAHDNPSPPPQDLAHPGVHYVPGKDGQFPSHAIIAPPSPFRPINLLERLNHLSDPPFDPSRNLLTPASDDRPDASRSSMPPPRGSIAPESCSPLAISVSMKSAPHANLASIDASSNQFIVDGLPPCSSQHADTTDDVGANTSFQSTRGLLGHLTTITSSLATEVFNPFSTQAINSSLTSIIPPASDVCPGLPAPIPGQQSCRGVSPLTPDARILSSAPSAEDGKQTIITSGDEVHGGEESLSTEDNNDPSVLDELQEGRYTSANSHQSLDPIQSSRSADVHSQPIEEKTLPTESTCTEQPPATPPQTPRLSVMHPDFSRSTLQRPIVTPTSKRPKNGLEMVSPVKFSSERNEVCRTPAQRVPIETALARGTPSYQRVLQRPTGSEYSQLGRFQTTRTPVFTRPALDDPSRSPAKRIPVTDLTTSPVRGDQSQSSPTRLNSRARSSSVEQRLPGPTLARSRSAEPCSAVSNYDGHEKLKNSIFPMPTVPPRSGTKLPFPLVPGQKLSDLPPSIPEENETGETTKETMVTLGRAKRSTISQLRQPSVNSRIPRIGNKPYARPSLNNGRAATAVHPTRAAKAPPSQLACKSNGVGNGNMEVSSTQPSNDILVAGSLKRKRGTEAAATSNSRPVMIRQVVPGMLSEKYAPKPAKTPFQVQPPSESSSPKVTQPLKFRKVVDGMLPRYAPAKTNPVQPELSDTPPSPLSDLSSSSNEELCDGKQPPVPQSSTRPKSETSDPSQLGGDVPAVEVVQSSLNQDALGLEASSRPRRTSRTRKQTQQQNVLDVFNGSTSSRPPPARRKPHPRTEGDGFMGMSATALKALTTSNTTKNQQTVAVFATEVIRKEGLRPESPTVKARTILQKQRDERDRRRRERAERKAQKGEEGLGTSDTEGQDDRVSLGEHTDHDENDCAVPQKHRRGPGDEADYETPERPERIIEPLKLEGADRKVKPVKQVKWHRGLSTAVYLDEVDPRPRPLPKNAIVRGCLAPTSKNLPLDPLGNLVDIDNRLFPELVAEHVTVKKYLYDNDIEPAPIPVKTTRSRSKRK